MLTNFSGTNYTRRDPAPKGRKDSAQGFNPGLGVLEERASSRRDRMKVAWHEVPGGCPKKDPSRRDGLIRADRPRTMATNIIQPMKDPLGTSSYRPYGTGPFWRFPRHFVPGYLHSVPPGQIREASPIPKQH